MMRGRRYGRIGVARAVNSAMKRSTSARSSGASSRTSSGGTIGECIVFA